MFLLPIRTFPIINKPELHYIALFDGYFSLLLAPNIKPLYHRYSFLEEAGGVLTGKIKVVD